MQKMTKKKFYSFRNICHTFWIKFFFIKLLLLNSFKIIIYVLEPEKVESRIIGGKLKNGGFLSTADSNNLDTSDDRDADLKMDTDDISSSFDNKVSISL